MFKKVSLYGFLMARNFSLEMRRSNSREFVRKRGGKHKKHMCAYEGGGGRILAFLVRVY